MVQSWIAALLLGAALASPVTNPKADVAKRHVAFGKRAPSADIVTDNVVTVRTVKTPMSRSVKNKLSPLLRRDAPFANGTAIFNNPSQVNYIASVTWGNQSFDMILDTGSSDTWVLQQGFQCLGDTGAPVKQSQCSNLGPTWSGNFTGGQIGNVNFNVTYGTGIVAGTFGFEDITIGGITVQNAQVAAVNEAYFNVNDASGLFGLAFQGLTSEFPGPDPTEDVLNEYITYSPVFYKMVNHHLSLPTFSFAPDRDGPNGQLAFGGVPPVNTTGSTAAAAIVTTTSSSQIKTPWYYTVMIDNMVFGKRNSTLSTNGTQFLAMIDSGTTAMIVPTGYATGIASAFSPPATLQSGVYQVQCNATAPQVAVSIGGVRFNISAADLILQPFTNAQGLCTIGVQDGGDADPFILGGTFMNNVLTTFDLGALEMRFTALA